MEARFILRDGPIIRQLLASRLHRKISLPQGDQRFAGIGVLDDEIAGVAGERPIFECALCAGTDIDHIEDSLEMVLDPVIALQTRFSRLLDHGQEMPKLGVFQNPGQFAGGPKFSTAFVGALDALEGVARGGNWWLIAHVIIARCQALEPNQ